MDSLRCPFFIMDVFTLLSGFSNKTPSPHIRKEPLLKIKSTSIRAARWHFHFLCNDPLVYLLVFVKNSLISSLLIPISNASIISCIHSVSSSSKTTCSLIKFFPPKYSLYSRQSGHHSKSHLRSVTLRPSFSTSLPFSVSFYSLFYSQCHCTLFYIFNM